MIVLNCGADGINSPLQVSQNWPQPSPDLEARRKTPQIITSRLKARAKRAYLANRDIFGTGNIIADKDKVRISLSFAPGKQKTVTAPAFCS